MYINHEDLRLWPHGSRICTYTWIQSQSRDSPDKLRLLTAKKVNDICNVMKKPGSKSAERMLDRGQLVSVIAQEKLKLDAYLFHHR